MKKINVLITHAGSEICHGIIKGLNISNLKCNLIVTGVNPLESGFYLANKGYVVPPSVEESEKFIEKVIEICNKENVDIVMSGGDLDLLPLARNKRKIEEETCAKVVVSAEKTLKICTDKYLTAEFLRKSKLPYPYTALPEDMSILLNKTDFPLFVKPRYGTGSIHTYTVRSEKEIKKILPLVPNPVIQECLLPADEEYTCGALYFNKLFGVIAMKRQLKRGSTFRAIVGDFKVPIEEASRITTALKPFGPANIQGYLTKRGFVVNEINCRFSGTTGMRAYAGFPEQEATIRWLLYKERIPLKPKPMVCLRYPQELFVKQDEIETLREKGCYKNPMFLRGGCWQEKIP